MTYGVIPTGFSRKPLAVILAEIEVAMITEFGPDVIQTSQSPLGQINGLMADLVTEIWERAEDIYQSYDPEQAEGSRLDILGNLRLVSRNGVSDEHYRRVITNIGQARVDVQDLVYALRGIDGVTYAQVFVNETGEIATGDCSTVSAAIIGGDDADIAAVMRQYIVPGVSTYGNVRVTTNIDGFCRSVSIIRPVEVIVDVTVAVVRRNDLQNCPPADLATIAARLKQAWQDERFNGLDVTPYSVRSIIERDFSNVEVISIIGKRNMITYGTNQAVPIGFVEIATLNPTVVLA